MELRMISRMAGVFGLALMLGACGLMPGQSSYDPIDPVEALEVPPDLDAPETDGALRVPNATYSRVQGGPVSGTSSPAVSEAPTPAQQGTRMLYEGGVRGLLVEDSEESVWRRVGFALERIGLSIEERERESSTYVVEYEDVQAKEARPNVFSRWIMRRKGPEDHSGTYQVRLRGQGSATIVNLYDEDGAPAGQVITEELLTALLDRLG